MVFESFGFENGQPAGVKQDIDFCHFGKSGESLKFGMRLVILVSRRLRDERRRLHIPQQNFEQYYHWISKFYK